MFLLYTIEFVVIIIMLKRGLLYIYMLQLFAQKKKLLSRHFLFLWLTGNDIITFVSNTLQEVVTKQTN